MQLGMARQGVQQQPWNGVLRCAQRLVAMWLPCGCHAVMRCGVLLLGRCNLAAIMHGHPEWGMSACLLLTSYIQPVKCGIGRGA